MNEKPLRPGDVRPDLRALLEYVGEQLGLGAGDTRYEVILSGGRFRYLYAHQRIDSKELERWSPPRT